MGLLRWVILGGVGYLILKANGRQAAVAADEAGAPRPQALVGSASDGLTARFMGREQADLAIEHLVQQHGVDRAAIFVEPIAAENTSGTAISGGDASSGRRVDDARADAALHGALKLSVATGAGDRAALQRVLEEAGGTAIAAS